MPETLRLEARQRSDRPDAEKEDVTFSPELARHFIEAYTQPGDSVLDPFAGYGTTLWVAESLGRKARGVEILADRAAFARSQLRDPSALVVGDSREISDLGLGPFELVLTSPPYMTVTDHPQDPLSGYLELGADYHRYIEQVAVILTAAAGLLGPTGHLVVNVADFGDGPMYTPLATDLQTAMASRLRLTREVQVAWDPPPEWVVRDVCLVYESAIDRPVSQDS